jgi:glycerol-3-phosphate acyltransferase PlsY
MAISLDGIYAFLALAIGYLFGSIPFGLLLTRLARTADLRSIGSGNIGATNVLRTGRKDLAAAALFHDETAGLAGAAGAFFGHLYPLWLRFRGGKGVATFLGGLIGVFWPGAIVFVLVWLATAASTRYSSAAALAASLAAPLAALALGANGVAAVFGALALLLWIKHSANIGRLFAGTETIIGGKG